MPGSTRRGLLLHVREEIRRHAKFKVAAQLAYRDELAKTARNLGVSVSTLRAWMNATRLPRPNLDFGIECSAKLQLLVA